MLISGLLVKRRFSDFVNGRGRHLIAGIMTGMAWALAVLGRDLKSLHWAMASHRMSYGKKAFRLIMSSELFRSGQYRELVTDTTGRDEAVGRSIVVRLPNITDSGQINSKGVLIVTFTKTFTYYLNHIDVRALSEYFHIVLEPSWAGYSDPDILLWAHLSAGVVVVQASEPKDRIFLSLASGKLFPVSFGASDWVDYRAFFPLSLQKKYDSVYVANTSPLKRVHRYFEAVHNIKKKGLKGYKGVLVCAAWGGKKKEIEDLAKLYGVDKDIDLRFSLKKEEVNVLLNESKVNILLSFKEGSNRSLFESMFSGTPVIALYENIGVNKAYINESTGMLINDWQLEDALIAMCSRWHLYTSRDWAMKHISPDVTTIKLRQVLRALSDSPDPEEQEFWVKTNNPEVNYMAFSGIDKKDLSEGVLRIFRYKEPAADPAGELRAMSVGINTAS